MESNIRYHSDIAVELDEVERRFVPLATSTRIQDMLESSDSPVFQSSDTTQVLSNNSTQFYSAQEPTRSSDITGSNESLTLSWDGYDEGMTACGSTSRPVSVEEQEGGLVAAFAGVLGSAAGARRDKDWRISTVYKTVYVKPPAMDGFLPSLIRELAPKPEEKQQLSTEQKQNVVAGFVSSGRQIRVYNACKKWKGIVKKVHKARESQVDAELKVALAGCLDKEQKDYHQEEAQKKKERIKRDLKWEKGIIRMVKYGQLRVDFKEGQDIDTASIIKACKKWIADTDNMMNIETPREALEGTYTPLRLIGGKGSPKKETESGNTETQTPGQEIAPSEERELCFRRGSIIMHSPPQESSTSKTTSANDRISELECSLVNKLTSGRLKRVYVDATREVFLEIKEIISTMEKQKGEQGTLTLSTLKEELMTEIRKLRKEVHEMKKPQIVDGENKMRKEIMEELGKVKKEIKEVREGQCAGSIREATIISSVDGVANKVKGMEEGLEKMRNCIVLDRANSQCTGEKGNDVEELSWSKVVKRGKTGKTLIPKNEPILAVYPGNGMDQPKCSKETLEKVKEVLDVRKEGIMVKNIREARNNGVIISLKDPEDVSKVVNGKALEKARLLHVIPGKKDPEILIYNIPESTTPEEFKKDLHMQNLERKGISWADVEKEVKVVTKKISRTGPQEQHWVVRVSARIRVAIMEQGRVYLGWSSHRVMDNVSVLRCFACQNFGHIAAKCTEAAMCGKCAGNHNSRDCPKTDKIKCGLCERRKLASDHMAGVSECPAYQWAVKKELTRRDYSNEGYEMHRDAGNGGSPRIEPRS